MFCINCGKLCARPALNCEKCLQGLRYEENARMLEPELERFVGRQYSFYERKWGQEQQKQGKWSWNFAAFLFSIVWLGYRKQYKLALFLLFLFLTADAVSYYTGWNYSVPIINMTIASFLLGVASCIGLGLFGNQLYYQHALHRIYELKAKKIEDIATNSYLLKKAGGTTRRGAALLLVSTLITSFASHRLFPTDADIVNTVRNGSLYNYPLYAIGDSFEGYFQEPSWYYYRASDGLELVEFHGYGASTERQKIVIQFFVDYHLGDIEPYSLEINGVMQGEEEFYELMDEVYSVQNPFELNDDLDEHSEKNAF